MLLFGNFHYEQVNNMGGTHVRTALLAVDRRDGRVVYEKNDTGPIPPTGIMNMEAEGDPNDKTVRIQVGVENITLNFTDKPLKAVVRRASGARKGPSDLSDALLDALMRSAGIPQ